MPSFENIDQINKKISALTKKDGVILYPPGSDIYRVTAILEALNFVGPFILEADNNFEQYSDYKSQSLVHLSLANIGENFTQLFRTSARFRISYPKLAESLLVEQDSRTKKNWVSLLRNTISHATHPNQLIATDLEQNRTNWVHHVELFTEISDFVKRYFQQELLLEGENCPELSATNKMVQENIDSIVSSDITLSSSQMPQFQYRTTDSPHTNIDVTVRLLRPILQKRYEDLDIFDKAYLQLCEIIIGNNLEELGDHDKHEFKEIFNKRHKLAHSIQVRDLFNITKARFKKIKSACDANLQAHPEPSPPLPALTRQVSEPEQEYVEKDFVRTKKLLSIRKRKEENIETLFRQLSLDKLDQEIFLGLPKEKQLRLVLEAIRQNYLVILGKYLDYGFDVNETLVLHAKEVETLIHPTHGLYHTVTFKIDGYSHSKNFASSVTKDLRNSYMFISPLSVALTYANLATVRTLLERGANPLQDLVQNAAVGSLNDRDKQYGNLSEITALVLQHTRFDKTNERQGELIRRLLSLAIQKDNAELVKFCLDIGYPHMNQAVIIDQQNHRLVNVFPFEFTLYYRANKSFKVLCESNEIQVFNLEQTKLDEVRKAKCAQYQIDYSMLMFVINVDQENVIQVIHKIFREDLLTDYIRFMENPGIAETTFPDPKIPALLDCFASLAKAIKSQETGQLRSALCNSIELSDNYQNWQKVFAPCFTSRSHPPINDLNEAHFWIVKSRSSPQEANKKIMEILQKPESDLRKIFIEERCAILGGNSLDIAKEESIAGKIIRAKLKTRGIEIESRTQIPAKPEAGTTQPDIPAAAGGRRQTWAEYLLSRCTQVLNILDIIE